MWVAIKRSSLALAVSLLLSPVAQAAESYKVLPSLSWSLDQVLDLANTDITGLTVAASTLDCSLYGNGGKITTDPAHVGAFICAADTGTGSAANSFETIAVPAGTSPVADSATDTLTLTETSFLTLTGTAGTDTIDITQVTTDLGTDGLIAANAVALSTDTTGNYVASVGDCTASEGSVPFAGACGTTLTPSAGTLTVAGDLLVTTSGANLGVQDTAGTAFNWHAGPTYSWFSDGDTRFLLMDGAANTLTLGDQGSQIANLKVFTSGNSILTGGLVVDTTTLVANATTNQVILGQAAALDPFSATPVLSLRTNTAAGTSMELQGIGGGDGPGLTGFTSNGSVTSPTDSSTGHVMLALNGVMRAGGDWAYEPVAALKMLVDGAVGVDDFPTRLELYTTPNGTPDPIRRLLIEEDGQTLLNASTDTSRSIISGPVLGSGFQIQSEGGTNSDLSFVTAGLSGSDADLIWLSSNGTLDTRTIVVDQDIIGAIGFAGYDGADYERCALIEGNIGRADGTAVTPASNDMPMYLELSTCADNSNSRTVRMLLDETGISVGNSTGARLWHDGDGALEITGQGNGTDECLALNLDDTSNVADFTNCASSTGVTTVQLTNLDFLVTGTGPNLGVQETSGTAFNLHGGSNYAWFSDGNADVRYLLMDGAANALTLGDQGAEITRLDIFTTTSTNAAVNFRDNAIGIQELDAVDEPANDEVYSFDSATGRGQWDAPGAGSDTNADKRFPILASACEPLEAADSIPPLTKTTGTNIDIFTRSFDAATDEGCKTTIVIPEDVQSGSTITFGFVWFSLTATTNAAVWDVRYTATGADGETWDAALTTETVTCTVAGTVNLRDICEVTETLANTGWAANDVISIMVYRDANNASDTLVGDAELEGVYIDVPRS